MAAIEVLRSWAKLTLTIVWCLYVGYNVAVFMLLSHFAPELISRSIQLIW